MRVLARRYLWISLCCAVFSAVYEYFSHGVFSGFMIFLFLVPLLLGAAPFFALSLTSAPVPGEGARGLYHAGVAALGTGSCLAGILEIYGTTSPYLPVYWAAGGLLALAGVLRYLLSLQKGGAG